MRMGAAAVDLHLGFLAAPAIDLNEGILVITDEVNPAHFLVIVIDLNEGVLAVTGDVDPAHFPAMAIDLNDGVLVVTDNFNPDCFAASAHDFNPGILAATSVDLNARSPFSWRAIIAGYLRRAACNDQSRERDQGASGSRAGRSARRWHRGAKNDGNGFPLASLTVGLSGAEGALAHECRSAHFCHPEARRR